MPEFQRDYVWNRDQVRSLMHSLYHRHLVGSLFVWMTNTDKAPTSEIVDGREIWKFDGYR